MKQNVKMLDKTKNSFIYFQLGLIATMVTVLFILELKFETTKNDIVVDTFKPIVSEKVFVYNPKVEVIKNIPAKTIVKVVQKVQPKVINHFVVSKDEVDHNVVKETTSKDSNSNYDIVENTTADVSVSKEVVPEVKDFFSVESLPMFPNCKGVSKENQKECFDKQLKMAIFKNLKYPVDDLENKKEGTVLVQFIIDENGKFTAIYATQSNRSTQDMKKAVEIAVKKLPKITPAKQGKNAVKIRYYMPISFKIIK
jgi:TonB family protein